MSFREKSAWAMALVMIVTGALYLTMVASYPDAPAMGVTLPWVLLVIILSIVVQTILALSSPREASAPADERERRISHKAAHFSSYVLATGVVVGLGQFMVTQDGSKMFHIILTCLILSHIAEYGAQILFFRRSV